MAERQIHICAARVKAGQKWLECAVTMSEPSDDASIVSVIYSDGSCIPAESYRRGEIVLTPHKGAITIPASDGE